LIILPIHLEFQAKAVGFSVILYGIDISEWNLCLYFWITKIY